MLRRNASSSTGIIRAQLNEGIQYTQQSVVVHQTLICEHYHYIGKYHELEQLCGGGNTIIRVVCLPDWKCTGCKKIVRGTRLHLSTCCSVTNNNTIQTRSGNLSDRGVT